jgi:membrane associated rhomboid family serine protease
VTRLQVVETLRRAGRATPWLSLAASLAGLLLSFGAAGSPRAYALSPARLFDGELLRLWTGHFVHYNAPHLWGDLLAFAAWATAVELTSRRLLALTLFCATPLLSLAILLTCPELTEYRGLSSLDCALVTELVLVRGFGIGSSSSRSGAGPLRTLALVSASAFALKCIYELASGHAVFARDLGPGVTLVVLAHPLGALAGVAAVLCARSRALASTACTS